MREFELQNDHHRRAAPIHFAAPERTKQKMLLSGLDCLPGQLDLFEVDALPKETDDVGQGNDSGVDRRV